MCQPPIDETYMPLELSWNELPAPGEVHVESVKGKVTLGLDLERPYAGHEVDMESTVTFERLGRNLVGPAEFEVERASLNRTTDARVRRLRHPVDGLRRTVS